MNTKPKVFEQLDQKIFAALETYSNVHRGSGHKSKVTTHIYEQARKEVQNFFKLNKSYEVIFCSPLRSKTLIAQLNGKKYKRITGEEIGLAIGTHALAIPKKYLDTISIHDDGGGTARLVAPNWVINAKSPDKFEAGTPAIINVITLACALKLTEKYGKDCFLKNLDGSPITAEDDYPDLSGKALLQELQKTVLGHLQAVPTASGNQSFINLDNSASTPTLLSVWNTFSATIRHKPDPQIIEQTKQTCSEFLNAPQDQYEFVFTSNTTESVNLLAKELGNHFDENSVILSSLLEHSSNDLPWRKLKGTTLERLNFTTDGFIDIQELKEVLSAYNIENKHGSKRIRLVAITGASNVLGACNDLAAIAKITHDCNARLFVDAAQLVAHRKIDLHKTGIDFLAFSAHKIYAPFGVGVLVSKKDAIKGMNPAWSSNAKEGEKNSAGIAALDKVLSLFLRVGMQNIEEKEQELTRYALDRMSKINGIKILGIAKSSHAEIQHKLGVIPFNLGNAVSFKVAKELAYQRGIGVRVGCHCAHIVVKKILGVGPGLENFQRFMQRFFSYTIFPGVVRISFGIENTKDDIENLAGILNKIASKKETDTKVNMKQELRKYIEHRAKLVYT